MMNKLRKLSVASMVAAGLLLSACSTTDDASDSGSYDYASGDMGVSAGDASEMARSEGGLAADGVTFSSQDQESVDNAQQEYVIKSANVTLQVDDVESKLDDVKEVVKNYEGEVNYSATRIRDRELTASSGMQDPYGQDYRYPTPVHPVGDYAYLTVSVPVESIEAFLEEVRGVGKVVTDSTSESDVTLEVLGLDARIESEIQSLERLEELLDRSNSVDEVLQVEREIQNRKNNIASMNAQLNSLKNRASESTVTIQLVTEAAVVKTPEEMNWWERTWDTISDDSSNTVAYSIIIVIFLLPLLGFFFLIKLILDRWTSGRLNRMTKLKNAQAGEVKTAAPASNTAENVESAPAPTENSTDG